MIPGLYLVCCHEAHHTAEIEYREGLVSGAVMRATSESERALHREHIDQIDAESTSPGGQATTSTSW